MANGLNFSFASGVVNSLGSASSWPVANMPSSAVSFGDILGSFLIAENLYYWALAKQASSIVDLNGSGNESHLLGVTVILNASLF